MQGSNDSNVQPGIRRQQIMEIFTVSFFGHRRISNTLIVENALSDAFCQVEFQKQGMDSLKKLTMPCFNMP